MGHRRHPGGDASSYYLAARARRRALVAATRRRGAIVGAGRHDDACGARSVSCVLARRGHLRQRPRRCAVGRARASGARSARREQRGRSAREGCAELARVEDPDGYMRDGARVGVQLDGISIRFLAAVVFGADDKHTVTMWDWRKAVPGSRPIMSMPGRASRSRCTARRSTRGRSGGAKTARRKRRPTTSSSPSARSTSRCGEGARRTGGGRESSRRSRRWTSRAPGTSAKPRAPSSRTARRSSPAGTSSSGAATGGCSRSTPRRVASAPSRFASRTPSPPGSRPPSGTSGSGSRSGASRRCAS